MTCNHCLPPCGCGAEAGLRLLTRACQCLECAFSRAANEPTEHAEPQWPELEAMERALADYGEAA